MQKGKPKNYLWAHIIFMKVFCSFSMSFKNIIHKRKKNLRNRKINTHVQKDRLFESIKILMLKWVKGYHW